MPDCGIDFVSRNELLSYEEMLRMLKIMKTLGVRKLRITGGEPMVRKGLLNFLKTVHDQEIMEGFHLTTNATITEPHVEELLEAGLKSVNISLDSLDRDQFLKITRRDSLDSVLRSMEKFLYYEIPVKLNVVVTAGLNEDQILPMAELARTKNVDVRFLEEMPFNGVGDQGRFVSYKHIEGILEQEFSGMKPLAFKTWINQSKLRSARIYG